jgi:hypothetical protein
VPVTTSPPSGGPSTNACAPCAVDNEFGRLRTLEEAYDPHTIALLRDLHLGPDVSCCEVGAGAGSIAKWMRENTNGPVVALDSDVVHLRELAGVDVIEANVRNWHAPRQFDVVHCRFLLDLLPRPVDTVRVLAETTAPRGYLVLEEFDDLTTGLAFGTSREVTRHGRVVAAKRAAFAHAGHQNQVGRYLPALVQAAGAFELRSSGASEVRQSGDSGVESWRRYLENQRAALLATGCIDEPTLDAYCHQLERPGFIYFAPMVVRVVAQKLSAMSELVRDRDGR